MDEIEWFLFINMYHSFMGTSDITQDVSIHISPEAMEVESKIEEGAVGEDGRYSLAFQRSPEYRQYLTCMVEDAAAKRDGFKNEYRIVRMNKFYAWGFEYKKLDIDIAERSAETVALVEETEVDRLLNRLVNRAVKEAVFEEMHAEQLVVEFEANLLEDACFWAEDDILEEIFNFYVPSLLKTMWDMPDLRKGMLEYAGLLQGTAKKKLLIDLKKEKNQAKEWFDKFMNDTLAEEKEKMPMDVETAAKKLQRVVRGMRGRGLMRKLVAQNWVKMYDKESGYCYYANLRTGETQWDRPKLMAKLWPNSTY